MYSIGNNDRTVAHRLHGILVSHRTTHNTTKHNEIRMEKRAEKKCSEWAAHTQWKPILYIYRDVKNSGVYVQSPIRPFKTYRRFGWTLSRAHLTFEDFWPFERDRHPEIIFHWMTSQTANVHRNERIFSVCVSVSRWLNMAPKNVFFNFPTTNFGIHFAFAMAYELWGAEMESSALQWHDYNIYNTI